MWPAATHCVHTKELRDSVALVFVRCAVSYEVHLFQKKTKNIWVEPCGKLVLECYLETQLASQLDAVWEINIRKNMAKEGKRSRTRKTEEGGV